MRAVGITGTLALVLFATGGLWAQPGSPAAMRTGQPNMTNASVEGHLPTPLQKAKIEQKLDAQLPLDLPFADERGVRRPGVARPSTVAARAHGGDRRLLASPGLLK